MDTFANFRLSLGFAAMALGLAMFAGCAASGPPPAQATNAGTQIGDARLQTKMSSTIFLQPVVAEKRVIYVDGHNTSGAQGVDFTPTLQQALFAKGYTLTHDPGKAEFILQYNLRYLGKETESHTAAGALAGGVGGAILEGAAGGSGIQSARAGIIGAGIGALVGYMMSENHYMMVVDLQIKQRMGSSWDTHRTRVAAEAAGRHLQFNYAKPALQKVVAKSIAGIF
ncbi:MAG: complement resistance protein TraT [Gammaproteobacteria bacterium]|nr:complement resistance protein TraT [Gammaproteobacteria bacterium]